MPILFIVRPMLADGIDRHQQERAEQEAGHLLAEREEDEQHENGEACPEDRRETQHLVGRVLEGRRHVVKGEGRRHAGSSEGEGAEALVVRAQGREQQGQAVADGHGDDDVRGDEERLVQREALAVGRGVEQLQQERPEHKVERHQPQQPGPLARLKPPEEKERDDAEGEIDEIEFFDRATDQEPPDVLRVVRDEIGGLRHDVVARAHGGMNALILAAGEGMYETADGARIAPVQGRVRHRGQRHVNVEECARRERQAHRHGFAPVGRPGQRLFLHPEEQVDGPVNRQHQARSQDQARRALGPSPNDGRGAENQVTQELRAVGPRLHREPEVAHDGAESHRVEDNHHRRIAAENGYFSLAVENQAGHVEQAVPEEHQPSELGFAGDHQHFHRDSRDEE